MTNKSKFTYKRIVDIFFIALLIFFTASASISLLKVPGKDDLENRSLKVVGTRCGEGRGYSSLLLEVEVEGKLLLRLLKPIKDCEDTRYRYLVGETVEVLWSETNKLSIWQASLNGRELTTYQQTKNEIYKERILTIVVFWCIFGFVFLVRLFKRRKIEKLKR